MSTDSDMTIAGCGRCSVRPAEASGLCKTCETALSLPADTPMVLVLREPTEAMMRAWNEAVPDAVEAPHADGWTPPADTTFRARWQAALSASPVGEGLGALQPQAASVPTEQAGGPVVGREQKLERALELALAYLSAFEPGDSRAVSNEYVAMAAVLGGIEPNDPGGEMAIIENALTALSTPSTTSTAEQARPWRTSANASTGAGTTTVAPSPGEGDAPVAWRSIETVVFNGGRIDVLDKDGDVRTLYANPEWRPEAKRRYTHWRPSTRLTPATPAIKGVVTDEWAERFCAAVNWSPDGQECKTVEGQLHCVSFRDLAKGYILAAIATDPCAPAKVVVADLLAISAWLDGLSSCPDLNDIAADGGVTVGMCYQQEAREFAGRLRRALAALQPQAQPAAPEGEG